jgi:hypothetical protein
LVGGGEGRFNLAPSGSDVRPEHDQVADLVDERRDRRDERGDRSSGLCWLGMPHDRPDDLAGVPGDRGFEVDVDPLRTDAVRMEADIVGAPAELLDTQGADRLTIELPPEETDLSAGERPLRGLYVLERSLDGKDRCHPQVREEPEERLRPGDRVESLHAEVLKGGERIDHEPGVAFADHLGPEHLLERGDGHLHARELRALTDAERDLGERESRANRRDVLERCPLVAHDVGDRVEHLDPAELGLEAAVVDPGLVGRLFQRDEEDALVPSDALAQELDRERGLPGTRGAYDEVRASGDETSLEHRVQRWVPGRDAGLRGRDGSALLDH